MRVQYQRANPDIGGDSLLVRFEGVSSNQTVCVLVNSGRGVDVDALLDDSRGESLGGIILNNAHPEHYCTLGENLRDDTPVYVAPDTAAILSDALTEPHARDIERKDAVLDQLVSIDDWTQIVRGLQIQPVPSGHAPGAAGILFEILNTDDEQTESHTMFVADEITVRRAAGYPGIGLNLPVSVDALVLSEPTETPFPPTLAETLSIICERARNDATVLVTADEPTGIHAAYLLGHLGKRLGSPFPITITGRIATLCEQLGYSIPNVTLLSDSTPNKILTPGTVAIACPTTPVQGISGQLFETLTDDPTAAVIRLTRGPATPMAAAQCMVQSFPWHNYTALETLDAVIEALAPVQVVLGARNTIDETSGIGPDCESFVWTVDDDLVYTLYDGTRWVAPAETDPEIEHRVRNRVTNHDKPMPSECDLSLPLPQRRDGINFEAEGLDIDTIQDRLSHSRASEFGTWRRPSPEKDQASTPASNSETTTSATDGGTTSIDASLAALHEQIDAIESTVTSRTYQASVVDAGDDMCLFRLQNPPVSLEHGQDITLVLDPTENTREPLTNERENSSNPDTTVPDTTTEGS